MEFLGKKTSRILERNNFFRGEETWDHFVPLTTPRNPNATRKWSVHTFHPLRTAVELHQVLCHRLSLKIIIRYVILKKEYLNLEFQSQRSQSQS